MTFYDADMDRPHLIRNHYERACSGAPFAVPWCDMTDRHRQHVRALYLIALDAAADARRWAQLERDWADLGGA